MSNFNEEYIGTEQKNPTQDQFRTSYSVPTYSSDSNPIATALKVISVIIFIGGFILGIVLGTQKAEYGVLYTYTKTEFSFTIALIYWAASFISGMLMLGFSEIINLLNSINNK